MNENLLEQKIAARVAQFQLLAHDKTIYKAALRAEACLIQGNKILVFGNGGSATQASHFAAELVNRFYFNRPALPALALVSDIANLTSIANDSSFQQVFSRQIEGLGKPGDLAIGISTSGRSPNVLEGLKKAKQMDLQTIALCGENTEALKQLEVDVILSIPSPDTPVVQELHLFLLHLLAELLEKNLFAGDK